LESELAVQVELVVHESATVAGTVTSGVEPVPGVKITARDTEGRFASRAAITQADGSFSVTGVPTGEVAFSVRGFTVLSPESLVVSASALVDVEVHVNEHALVRGRVHRNGQGVAGVTIVLTRPGSQASTSDWASDTPETTSVAGGEFELRPVPPGAWTISARRSNGAELSRPRLLSIAEGDVVEGVELELAEGATVHGVVTNRADEPVLVEVRVVSVDGDTGGTASTDSNGEFSVDGLAGDREYLIQVWPKFGTNPLPIVDGVDTVHVGAFGSTNETAIVVDFAPLQIAGVVVDENGAGRDDIQITARALGRPLGDQGSTSTSLQHATSRANTDGAGRFVLDGLQQGMYELVVRGPTGSSVLRSDVSAGEVDLEITLPQHGRLRGTLEAFASLPEVRLGKTSEFSWMLSERVAATGSKFAVSDLAPGDYMVVARGDERLAFAVVSVVPGEVAEVTLRGAEFVKVRGRVVEIAGGPVGGMRCFVAAQLGAATASSWDPGLLGVSAHTAEDGSFELQRIYQGPSAVVCRGSEYSTGHVLLGGDHQESTEVEVPVVRVGGGATMFGAILVPLGDQFVFGRVAENGPAAKAGIREGDVVVSIDGMSVERLGYLSLKDMLFRREAGTVVVVEVTRNEAVHMAQVVVSGQRR
jgi:hypothetical protein